jgi:hypothetical protein
MAQKIVTARIDAQATKVTLEGEGVAFPNSFIVEAGDTLKWTLQDLPAGSTARVRFVTPGAPLLKRGNTLEANGVEIDGGAVGAGAADGPYRYEVVLLTGKLETKLTCLWSDGRATGMGGGDKSGGK